MIAGPCAIAPGGSKVAVVSPAALETVVVFRIAPDAGACCCSRGGGGGGGGCGGNGPAASLAAAVAREGDGKAAAAVVTVGTPGVAPEVCT